jgi:hypothetical protein
MTDFRQLTRREFKQLVREWTPAIKSRPKNQGEVERQLRALHAVGCVMCEYQTDRSDYGSSFYSEMAKLFGRSGNWLAKVKLFAEIYSPEQLERLCEMSHQLGFSHVTHLLSVKDRRVRNSLQRRCARDGWSVRRLQLEVRRVIQPVRSGGPKYTAHGGQREYLLDLLDRSRGWRLRFQSAVLQFLNDQSDEDTSELILDVMREVRQMKATVEDVEKKLGAMRRSANRDRAS